MKQKVRSCWQNVADMVGNPARVTLGKYFSYEIFDNPRWVLHTYSRYKFAARLLGQSPLLNVLEFGCNEGYGTVLLAEVGHKLLAVDQDQDAIKWAQKNMGDRITFLCQDILGKHYGRFDAIVSLDVIEHIEDEAGYFKTIIDNLKADGFCIIGTPSKYTEAYASKISQANHVNLFTPERLRDTMQQYFKRVFLFGMNDEVVHTGFYQMCHYLIILGCGLKNEKGA